MRIWSITDNNKNSTKIKTDIVIGDETTDNQSKQILKTGW